MTLETFFEKFNQFADAPDAVAKMRELILESAIRGMLVPHNASDEPASELLKRIARLQDGQVRKQAALPSVGDDAYLEIPPGWEWTRLGNTGRIFNGDSVSESGKAELAKVEDGLPFIATKDVGYGRAALVYVNGLKVPLRDPRFKVARANAVLICAEGGSAGRKIGVTDRDICFGNKLFANEVWEGIHHRYVFYVYQAPTFFKEFAARMTGIIGGIARSEFLSLPFPLPPLGEQRRIVAKMDELMALCDRLEAQQQERETRHAALARASLARFADAPTPANLPFLFHPSYAIPPADLRKSILDLAVYGKLSAPAPDDDEIPSLEEFREAAASLANSLGLRSPKESLDEAEPPFDVPGHWRWMALADLGAAQTGTTPSKNDHEAFNGDIPFIKPADILPDGVNYSNESLTRYGAESGSRLAPAGSLLMVCIGTIGKCNLIERECAFNQQINSLSPVQWVDSQYLLLAVRAPYFQDAAWKKSSSTTIAILNKGKWLSIPVPIPPLAEQRRIVAKVEQLMALVDALETQLAASRATAANLLSAFVAELTAQG